MGSRNLPLGGIPLPWVHRGVVRRERQQPLLLRETHLLWVHRIRGRQVVRTLLFMSLFALLGSAEALASPIMRTLQPFLLCRYLLHHIHQIQAHLPQNLPHQPVLCHQLSKHSFQTLFPQSPWQPHPPPFLLPRGWPPPLTQSLPLLWQHLVKTQWLRLLWLLRRLALHLVFHAAVRSRIKAGRVLDLLKHHRCVLATAIFVLCSNFPYYVFRLVQKSLDRPLGK